MIDGVILRPLTVNADARGWLTEVFRQDQMATEVFPRMGYVSMTLPGVERGPHEHVQQTDVFAFMGPGTFLVDLYDGRMGTIGYGERVLFTAGRHNPLQVTVPPGVIHGYKNVSDEPGIVMNFPNQLYRGWGGEGPVDEIRYECMRASDHVRQDLPDHLFRPAECRTVAADRCIAVRASGAIVRPDAGAD